MKNEIYDSHKSSIGGLDANLVAMLSYLLPILLVFVSYARYAAWLVPLTIFLIEKESNLVKFHAMQSFLLNIVAAILAAIIIFFGSLFLIKELIKGSFYGAFMGGGSYMLAMFAVLTVMLMLAIIAIIGAYNYKEVHIPIIGSISSKSFNK